MQLLRYVWWKSRECLSKSIDCVGRLLFSNWVRFDWMQRFAKFICRSCGRKIRNTAELLSYKRWPVTSGNAKPASAWYCEAVLDTLVGCDCILA